MRGFLCLALLGLLSFAPRPAVAQLEVDANEVRRRGDLVVHVDPESRADVEPAIEAFMQITELPTADVDKWFIYVVGQKNCPACDRLKEQWASDPTLRAYAVPDDPKASWAHFTWYYLDDKLQAFRWDKNKNPHALDIKATPTIVCQPPRSGKYGDPGTVVFQYVYEGDPKAFASKLNGSIKSYCEYLSQRGALPQQQQGVTAFGNRTKPTPVSNGGLWNVAPEKVAKYAPTSVGESGPQGFGQVQIPPVDLPNEPKPDQSNDRPLLDRFLHEPTIVVVRDAQELPSEETNEAVKATVEQLQPSGDELKVKQVPVEGNPWGVKPEETPVVLKVRGKDVIEKLAVEPDEEKHFLITTALIGLAIYMFGGYTTSHIVGGLIGLIFKILIIGAIVLIVVLVLKNRQATPTPAPTLTDEDKKQIAAQVAASAAKTKAAE